ncbi:response regulator [Bacteriovorax sp. DB6_IX]|uniref:response regulator n=1 Tax=Bacteriovorax sp. DB6_IX TaxID=1353530 RepID=UPI00038A2152|nr:response regulator [Bacteriovorax sp. DB6_IX]EQC50580.1 response regulator receiver domain protein [Bacteriovorax sp. DB6_IX]
MKKHILVVDDCEDVRFLLALKLNNMGLEVSEASDGQDAIEILEEDEVDILLMDVIMPKISGQDLIRYVQRNKKLKRPIIICITAHYDEQTKNDLIELGADSVITKPIKGDILNSKIKEYLHKIA